MITVRDKSQNYFAYEAIISDIFFSGLHWQGKGKFHHPASESSSDPSESTRCLLRPCLIDPWRLR